MFFEKEFFLVEKKRKKVKFVYNFFFKSESF